MLVPRMDAISSGVTVSVNELAAADALDVDKPQLTLSASSRGGTTTVYTNPEILDDYAKASIFSEKSNTGSNVPPEILFSIFPRAIPPYDLLDTTLSVGSNSAWCQTLRLMQSIVLVCRSWYDVGIVFLYENVSIRRYHQLESLRETLASSTANHLRPLVKSLTIQCYIPEDQGHGFRASIKAVMGCCTSLSTFVNNSAIVPPKHAMPNFPAQITHLRLEGNFDYGEVPVILIQLEKTLISFHLTIWATDFEESVKNNFIWARFLVLESLRSLSIIVQPGTYTSRALDCLQIRWAMPSLQRFTVITYNIFDLDDEVFNRDLQTAIVRFLVQHGRELRQLQIRINGWLLDSEAFKEILSFCPRLERIIVHPYNFLRQHWTDSEGFFHPHLRWVDFTHYLRDLDTYSSAKLFLSKRNLPALESVRHFCNFPLGLQKWLGDCPPSADAEFVIDVFQHQLDYREGLFVWRFERDFLEDDQGGHYSGSFTVWSDSDGSEYVHSSSDGSDTSSSEGWTTNDDT